MVGEVIKLAKTQTTLVGKIIGTIRGDHDVDGKDEFGNEVQDAAQADADQEAIDSIADQAAVTEEVVVEGDDETSVIETEADAPVETESVPAVSDSDPVVVPADEGAHQNADTPDGVVDGELEYDQLTDPIEAAQLYTTDDYEKFCFSAAVRMIEKLSMDIEDGRKAASGSYAWTSGQYNHDYIRSMQELGNRVEQLHAWVQAGTAKFNFNRMIG